MKRKALYILGVILFYILQLIYANSAIQTDLMQQNRFYSSQNEQVHFLLLPDPALSNQPNIHLNASSSEFSYSSTIGEVNLTWQHTSGVELSYPNRETRDSNLPDCNDFIYYYQDIEWKWNDLPSYVYFSADFNVELQDDFANKTFGDLMFSIHIWFIDSSDTWIEVASSEPPYHDFDNLIVDDLNYFQIGAIFGGTIEDESGHQEDPSDTISFAIGFSPTWLFQDTVENEIPWMVYNGSVNVSITYLSVGASIFYTPDYPDEMIPIHNGTSGAPNFNRAHAIFSDEDGNIFTIGISDNLGVESLSLIRWTTETNLQWRRLWNYSGIFFYSDALLQPEGLFITGYSYSTLDYTDVTSHLIMYSIDGVLLWNRTFTIGGRFNYVYNIAIDDAGNIYLSGINGSYQGQYEYDLDTFFARLDSEGNSECILLYEYAMYQAPLAIDMLGDGSLIVSNQSFMAKMGADGETQWRISEPLSFIASTKDGSIYALTSTFPTYPYYFTSRPNLTKWTTDGGFVWNKTIPIITTDLDLPVEDIVSIVETGDNCLYALIQAGSNTILAKIDGNGRIVFNHTLGVWTSLITSGKNGLVFVASHQYTQYGTDIWLLAYTDYTFDHGLLWYLLQPQSLAIYGAITMIFVLVIVDYLVIKKRKL